MYWRKPGAATVACSALTIGAQSPAAAAPVSRPADAPISRAVANSQLRYALTGCSGSFRSTAVSRARGHHLEIFGLHMDGSVRGPVVPDVEGLHVAPKILPFVVGQSGKGPLR